MDKYDYRECVCDDIREYIKCNDIKITTSNREDIEEKLNDDLWCNDSVTGNASGSYTFNAWQAEENLCHNYDLLAEAIDEFGADAGTYKDCLESPETADVTIRCYLLGECIGTVLDELEVDMEDHFEQALEFIREKIDEQELNSMISSAMYERVPFSVKYPHEADEIADSLEEYGQDNDLPEGWWLEYGDIDDIAEQI